MKILILGSNGMLGPYVERALQNDHDLLLTDVEDEYDGCNEYSQLDVSDLDGVISAAEGVDAIVNLSVLRPDRQIAFDVNARGCYNMMEAAVKHGISRVVNTGPHFTIAGPNYEDFEFNISTEIPSQSGTGLYAHTKSLGQEICRVFSENHDLHVITLLFYNFREPDDNMLLESRADPHQFVPFSVTWEDAARAFPLALEIPKTQLPSRCEIFNIFCDLPHGQFQNEKSGRILGWKPTDNLDKYWKRDSI